MRRLILVTAWLVVLGAAAGGVLALLKHREANQQENIDYARVSELLKQSKGVEAVAIASQYRSQLSATAPTSGRDWLPLLAQGLAESGDASALSELYQKYPRVAQVNEDAALLIASTELSQRKLQEYQSVRDAWVDNAQKPAAWFVLDADALIVQGKREEALKRLQSKSFQGPDDTGRLVRIAILQAPTNLSESWNVLGQALEKDPGNPDVTSYRAQVLEAINKPTLARLEYLSAIQKSPQEARYFYQLGDFYRRLGQYSLAINAWRQGISLPDSDQLWLKMLFWSKMTVGLSPALTESTPTTGELAPLLAFLRDLPQDRFWDEAAYAKVENGAAFLRNQQETFWLRLADALQRGDERKATQMLEHNPFHSASWAPLLEQTLARVLAYRRVGTFYVTAEAGYNGLETALAQKSDAPPRMVHEFVATLQRFADKAKPDVPATDVPPDLRALLTSKYAFPATFLAAGWLEAALVFPVPDVVPAEFPQWVAFAYTQAIRVAQSPEEALKFATKQVASDPLNLLIGELMITSDSIDAGVAILKPLTLHDDAVGQRAAWLVSLVQIQRDQLTEAKDTIHKHHALAQSVAGKEALARIALKEGDVAKADKLYGAIEKDSLEAKLYLARRAYSEKNYSKALKLTEQLVIEFPDNQELLKDLEALRALNQQQPQHTNK